MPGSERDYERSFGAEFRRVSTERTVNTIGSSFQRAAQENGAGNIRAEDVTLADMQGGGTTTASSGYASVEQNIKTDTSDGSVSNNVSAQENGGATPSLTISVSSHAYNPHMYDMVKAATVGTVAWEIENNPSLFGNINPADLSQEFRDGLLLAEHRRVGRDYQGLGEQAWSLVQSEVLFRYKADEVPSLNPETNMFAYYNNFESFQSLSQSVERGVGDCEDFAIATYGVLRAAGVPAEQLLIMGGGLREQGSDQGLGGHAALVWSRPDGVRMIFDVNLDQPTTLNPDFSYGGTLRLNTASRVFQFDPFMMFNEHNVFEVENYQPALPQSPSVEASASGPSEAAAMPPAPAGAANPPRN